MIDLANLEPFEGVSDLSGYVIGLYGAYGSGHVST